VSAPATGIGTEPAVDLSLRRHQLVIESRRPNGSPNQLQAASRRPIPRSNDRFGCRQVRRLSLQRDIAVESRSWEIAPPARARNYQPSVFMTPKVVGADSMIAGRSPGGALGPSPGPSTPWPVQDAHDRGVVVQAAGRGGLRDARQARRMQARRRTPWRVASSR